MAAAPVVPEEVLRRMRWARWQYAALAAATYAVASGIAVVFVLSRGADWQQILVPLLILGALLAMATLARPLSIQRPVVQPVSLAAADAAEALVDVWRGRGSAVRMGGGVFVSPAAIAMPAWFVDTPDGTWMVTTRGTAWHMARALKRTAVDP